LPGFGAGGSVGHGQDAHATYLGAFGAVLFFI